MRPAKAANQTDPPFLPLEETTLPKKKSLSNDAKEKKSFQKTPWLPKLSGKKIIAAILGFLVVIIVFESFFVNPEDRLIQPDFSDKFLLWVQSHPQLGLWAISIVIAAGVVTMVPVGTPLTIGCGYIYRGLYGWKLGMFVATAVSMTGSCLGAVSCFLIGRYLMRETVQKWVRKYPLFDAIDVAASKEGFKIMSMLYLTPVLPLGLVSYMCGTTSMRLASFAAAKIASLPLYLLYTFIGASAHSFMKHGGTEGDNVTSALEGTKKIEENEGILVAGLVLSTVMMTLITRHIRKELMQILENQKRDKNEKDVENGEKLAETSAEESGVEMGLTARRRAVK
mmetsp:Transcript_27931/g.67957  ORF Transcript_27931/g.67957 Transcript_27931/m.67957 type:complete len:339 (-) Transcript_27931:296-1312(-)|eukprot:CAMPEP_0113622918 /NCGR_PEP_ID=MMETSP0017_2-20120614/11767_1 /TAXON_ID=2856 /ORGANISM="Cylindrotheca closterium" /LENGTH=338 /DNA_ID=CAMNT_0000532807 /DNA_START=25 /DNA_END=1041 /DNA_ORIENTATION=- /assembly_acc=CAM_ASM_000147